MTPNLIDLVPNAYLLNLNPFAIQFSQTFGIRWYALSYLSGFAIAFLVISTFAKRGLSPLAPNKASDFIFNAAVGTIIGGRLGYCIFYAPELFLRFSAKLPFWGVLAINEGGMASHGGIVGIVVACLISAKKFGVPALHLSDLCALTGPIGIFFGRIANFINGELVGRPVETPLSWAVKFPQDIYLWPTHEPARLNSLSSAVEKLGVSQTDWANWVSNLGFDQLSLVRIQQSLSSVVDAVIAKNLEVSAALRTTLTARHPSQLYEALLEGLILFIVLLFLWRKARKPGVITASFFSVYALVRIIGEQFRMPDAQIGFQALGLTRGQWLSVVMLAIGLILLKIWSARNTVSLGGWGRSSG